MENIADYYYNKLNDVDQAGKLLTQMAFQLFEVDSKKYYRRVIQSINKAIKVYGKYRVYFALLSMTTMDNINFDTYLYPLISAIILKNLKTEGRSSGQYISENYEKEINKLEKKVNKAKKEKLTLEYPTDE